MPKVTGEGGEGVQAVALALKILERLAEEGKPMGVTALAEALGTTKSRIFRHLHTLKQYGYILQSETTERYRIGSRLLALARAASDNQDLAIASYRALRALREGLGHSAVLSQVEPEGARILSTITGKSTIEIGVRAGSLLPFHSSAHGKVALTFGSESLRAEVLSSRLEKMTEHTITTASALRAEIERIRHRGWATAPNESLIGINTLAAPIFEASGALVGAVAIVDSVQFIAPEPTKEQIAGVLEAARSISAELGYVLD
ncbi:IclR family transcriptional regulator [Acidimangrovimonas sediminis]|uniref:IclR family transcriptional regulator n=1 Tax=Acidimangrovimonas sediminis TaxID=2056283 RepID=UPI0011AF6553|nr:IclR family transcriptional regulator [Acidimangrovimonas sediminis]